jgi:short-subunit dehydrogenase
MSGSNFWTGKRVWIVGASSGIGAALARELASRGARLALSARSTDALSTLAIGLLGSGHRALPLDTTDAAAVGNAASVLQSEWGGIDVAVLGAAAYSPMRAFALDLPAAQQTMRVNIEGVLNCLAALVPSMLDVRKGHIAIIASVAGYRGLPQALAYGASKAALINMAETLHLDLAERGIKVQLISPGFVRTPLTAKNDFKMPALMEPEQAARCITEGLESSGFEIHFPLRFTLLLKLLQLLPYRMYFPLVKRITGL